MRTPEDKQLDERMERAIEESQEKWFERQHGGEPECLSRLEAEVATLYDSGFHTHEKIWSELQARDDSPKSTRRLLTAEDVRVILRKYHEYRKMYPQRSGAGRPRALTWPGYQALIRLMDHNPNPAEYGYAQEAWTKRLLLDALRRWGNIEISEQTLTRVLHKSHYWWNGEKWECPRDRAPTPDARWLHQGIACRTLDAAILEEDRLRINAVPADPSLSR
jgi:hypothetical protein